MRQRQIATPGENVMRIFAGNFNRGGLTLRIRQRAFVIVGELNSKGMAAGGRGPRIALVGGIGIMNLMLVSVTEQTPAAGIRMARARGRATRWRTFLTEGVASSRTGGAIGIAAGIAASKILTASKHWPTATSPEAMGVAFRFRVAVGIFFEV